MRRLAALVRRQPAAPARPARPASRLAGYAAARLLPLDPVGIAVWFLGAVIGHDLLLMPLYSLADRSAMAVFRHRAPQLPATPWINYLRVPAALSGLLLLIWFPLILRLQSPLPRVDDAVRGPVPLALARGDGRAVPAVRRRARPAAGSGPAQGTEWTYVQPGNRRSLHGRNS